MASLVAASSVAAPASFPAPAVCSASSEPRPIKAFAGLKGGSSVFSAKAPQLASKTVANGSRVSCMQVLNPYTNIKYETLSYLPPLSPEQIAKQVDYIVGKGWIPCLEFDKIGSVYIENFHGSGYYDGRYWTMWKLPMFGCQDSAAVLREIKECEKAYPSCYIRVLGFDNKRQVQCISFVVHKPSLK